jgi:soluble lytic murein transglycosylase-like protein
MCGKSLAEEYRVMAVDSCAAAVRLRSHRAALLALSAALIALAIAPAAQAREVPVPLTIDYLTLSEALRADLYTAPGGRAPLWNGSDACQFLYAENPRFGRAGERVMLETAASLGLGFAIAGRCISPVSWSGIVEAESQPYIATGLKLKFRIADLNLYNPQHEKSMLVGKGFDLIKQYLIPRLETFSYDLNPSVQQLAMLAEDASTPEVADRIKASVATLRAMPQVEAREDGVRVTLVITVPEFPLPAASPSPVTATPEEIAAFQKRLDEWDAFLVFAIKQLGANVGDEQFRRELMQILLNSRYKLAAALAQPPSAAGPDPVRVLFLETWQDLGAAVHEAARRGKLGARGLQFLSFVSAGDALFALDEAAPALGMRISAADLRRLAHIMAPTATGNPLEYNFNEDQELKDIFGVTEPPSSGPLPEGEEPPPAAPPTAGGTPAAPAPPAPTPSAAEPAPPTPAASPSASPPGPERSGWLRVPMWLLEPADACAGESDAMLPALREAARRLGRAVVDSNNAPRYRDDMARLLELSADHEISESKMDRRYQRAFRDLVKSAAWQESCWRQFVRTRGRVKWLESSSGDIGLMQVNKHVWRGFYNLQKLKWDVLYNAGAGAEILDRMMTGVLGRPHIDPFRDDSVELARSTYAAYNGGPDAYNRWRRGVLEPDPARAIDSAFLAKYRATVRGGGFDILSCAANWGRAPGH